MPDEIKKISLVRIERPLGPSSQRIVDLRFAEPKLTQNQIAERLGISAQRVSTVLRSPRVRREYRALAKKELSNMVPDAIGAQRDLLKQRENLEVARKVSERVLEDQRILEKDAPTTQINLFNGMNPQELKEYVTRIQISPDFVVDAEVIDGGLDNRLDNGSSPKA